MLCAVAALTCRSHCPPQLHTVSPGHRALAGHLPRLLFKAPSARYVAVACTGPLRPPHTSLVWHTRVAPSRTVPPRLGQCLGRLLFRKCCWVHTVSSVSSLPETQGQHGPRQVQGKHSLLCPVCVRRQPDSFVQMSHLKKKKVGTTENNSQRTFQLLATHELSEQRAAARPGGDREGTRSCLTGAKGDAVLSPDEQGHGEENE